MQRQRVLAIMTLVSIGLGSCNTTDALTPQAEIGTSSGNPSTPVTQADTERLARSPRTNSPSGVGSYPSGPQNTLEAQARAIEAGSAVSPASSGPPPLASAGSGDDNQGIRQAEADGAPASQAAIPAAPAATIRFLPIIGAPVQAVTPLSRQLGAEARSGGLTIRPSSDNSAEHILKGYFSAFTDGSNVTLVYVWDILDKNGARLHRMQGQDRVAARGSDPWTAVPASLMEQIATRTIQDYLAWRNGRAG